MDTDVVAVVVVAVQYQYMVTAHIRGMVIRDMVIPDTWAVPTCTIDNLIK